jgi:F0F1-type ATP synthase alpha subunit
MVGKFEEQYFDVLRALEEAIYTFDQQQSDLVDYNVNKVLDGLVRLYTAEEKAKRMPNLKFNATENALSERIKQVCELYLGRDPDIKMGDEVLTVSEIIACLKRIRRSVEQMGGKGRRGYLEFIAEFFGE